jgi:hypothetical protein
MFERASSAIPFYRISAYLALPGTLWAAFEMYVLTLGGAQMLFFSIVHTMPPLVLAVLVSVPALAAWLIQSLAALIVPKYRAKLKLPYSVLLLFTFAASLHLILLASYEKWSLLNGLRIAICLLGIASVLALLVQAVRHLRWSTGQANAGA